MRYTHRCLLSSDAHASELVGETGHARLLLVGTAWLLVDIPLLGDVAAVNRSSRPDDRAGLWLLVLVLLLLTVGVGLLLHRRVSESRREELGLGVDGGLLLLVLLGVIDGPAVPSSAPAEIVVAVRRGLVRSILSLPSTLTTVRLLLGRTRWWLGWLLLLLSEV